MNYKSYKQRVIRNFSGMMMKIFAMLVFAIFCSELSVKADVVNYISTVMGNGTDTSTGTGGVASQAAVGEPAGIWEDSNGVVYVAEYSSNCVRKFPYPNGIVAVVAGICERALPYNGDNMPATSSYIVSPVAAVVAASGIVYIGDQGNSRIRAVSTSGIITTICGTGADANTGDDGPATSASLDYLVSLWIDTQSQLFVLTFNDQVIRKITTGSSTNTISLFAGSGTAGFSGDGGQATSATFYAFNVIGDTNGVMYVADSANNRIRTIATDGIVSTIIGGINADNEGLPGTSTSLLLPFGVVVDTASGDVYVATTGYNRVQAMSGSTGIVTTFAGNGDDEYDASLDNGPATSATLTPHGLFLDTDARLYITESSNCRVRLIINVEEPTVSPTVSFHPSVVPTIRPTRNPSVTPSISTTMTPSISSSPTRTPTLFHTSSPTVLFSETVPIISTILGNGSDVSAGTGLAASEATTNYPYGIWKDSNAVVYISEVGSNCVRKFPYSDGIVAVVAGKCESASDFDGDNGPATSGRLNFPAAIAVATTGIVYIGDSDNYRIRKVSTSGIITTFCGDGGIVNTGDNGPASSASISLVYGMWIDSLSQLYLANMYLNYIRKIDTVSSSNTITTIAGEGNLGFSGDGGPATSAQVYVAGISVDTNGNLYIADPTYYRIREIDADGIINTIIGTGQIEYNGEFVPATSANIYDPHGVAVDSETGDIYVSAAGNYIIQVMSGSTGLVITYAGNISIDGYDSSQEGRAATKGYIYPYTLFMDADNHLLVTEYFECRVSLIEPNEVSAGTDSNSDSNSDFTSALSAGTVIGIIIGGVAVLLIVAGIVNYLMRPKTVRSHVVPTVEEYEVVQVFTANKD